MNLLYDLPIDLQIKIWEYNDEWRETFQLEVLPYIQRDWFVKWVSIKTNDYGIDIRESCMNKKTKKYNNNYIDSKKLCDEKIKKTMDIFIYLIINIMEI